MDPVTLSYLAPAAAVGFVSFSLAWVLNTWLRVRHGYPLANSWGKTLYPQQGGELVERSRMLTQENAQLRAELGSVKDRLGSVERIVTDRGYQLSHEIERLSKGEVQ